MITYKIRAMTFFIFHSVETSACCANCWNAVPIERLRIPVESIPDSKVHGANMGPTLASWTLLSGYVQMYGCCAYGVQVNKVAE